MTDFKVASVERRSEPRQRASFAAKIVLVGTHLDSYEEVSVIDVSENGLAFTTARHVEIGVQMEVHLKGCHLICEVRNARYREYSNAPGYIVGVQIVEVLTGAQVWQQLTKEYRAA